MNMPSRVACAALILSALAGCSGEQDELQQWEGKTIPLAAFSLGSLRLRDVRIDCQNGLSLDATFGR